MHATALPTVPELLRSTAAGYRDGTIRWGTHWYITPASDGGCTRCALGGIAYAADSGNPDGNPFLVAHPARQVAAAAVEEFAAYLVEELGAVPAYSDGAIALDSVETVGAWNDEPGRSVAEIVTALAAAADRVEQRVAGAA